MKKSRIVAINELADQLPGCIRFDKGSLRIPFPEEFYSYMDDVKRNLRGKYFQYPSTGGQDLLREKVAEIEAQNGRMPSPKNIVITHGGISSLYTLFAVLTRPQEKLSQIKSVMRGLQSYARTFNLFIEGVIFPIFLMLKM